MTVVPASLSHLIGARRLPPGRAQQVLDLHSGKTVPVEPRHAATVILARDTDFGPEIYVLRRQSTMAFASGQYVFPGGSVDTRDESIDVGWVGPEPPQWAQVFTATEPVARALVCAAIRETFEESGVLLAGPDAHSVVADTSGADWEVDRVALIARELSFADFLRRRGLLVRADLIVPWAHWITPAFEPRRFDTRFLVAAMPHGQVTREFGEEADQVEWVRPLEAVARWRSGDMAIMPPTLIALAEMGEHDSVASVLAAAPSRTIFPVQPHVVLDGDNVDLVLPGDPGYPGDPRGTS
ncbi:MAG: NUDIX hydrolase [Sporichthyaceae bacterium]